MTALSPGSLDGGLSGSLRPSAFVPTALAGVVPRLRGWVARRRLSHMTHGPADDIEALIALCVEMAAALAPVVAGPPIVGPLTQRGRDALAMARNAGVILDMKEAAR